MSGPPVHRSTGPPVHRSTGPPVHRSTGPPVHRSSVRHSQTGVDHASFERRPGVVGPLAGGARRGAQHGTELQLVDARQILGVRKDGRSPTICFSNRASIVTYGLPAPNVESVSTWLADKVDGHTDDLVVLALIGPVEVDRVPRVERHRADQRRVDLEIDPEKSARSPAGSRRCTSSWP